MCTRVREFTHVWAGVSGSVCVCACAFSFAEGEPTDRVLLGRFASQRIELFRGAWGAQSAGCPTSAQVTISWSVGSSPTSGSVLTAHSLDPIPDSVSPSLFPSSTHIFSLSLSLKKNIKKRTS